MEKVSPEVCEGVVGLVAMRARVRLLLANQALDRNDLSPEFPLENFSTRPFRQKLPVCSTNFVQRKKDEACGLHAA